LFIPSPSINAVQLGPLTIHFYALCLIAGIGVAWVLGERRWQARGGVGERFENAVLWAIPIGIVGARIYHVLTHLGDYFGPGRNPWSVFFIWEGGIAIFGAIGFGALGAFLACRRQGIRMSSLADCLAPGIAFGQAIGRFGNWFNQELYGWPTTAPWGLEIDPAHRVPGFEQYATFQPMFAFEAIWDAVCGITLLLVDRRFKLGRGKLFALYVALYGFGRSFTEGVRLDYSYDTFGPIRFNQAVAMLICLAGLVVFFWLLKNRPGRETSVLLRPVAVPAESAEASGDESPAKSVEASGDESPADPVEASGDESPADPVEASDEKSLVEPVETDGDKSVVEPVETSEDESPADPAEASDDKPLVEPVETSGD